MKNQVLAANFKYNLNKGYYNLKEGYNELKNNTHTKCECQENFWQEGTSNYPKTTQ